MKLSKIMVLSQFFLGLLCICLKAQEPTIVNTTTKADVLWLLNSLPVGHIISGQHTSPRHNDPNYKENGQGCIADSTENCNRKPFEKIKKITGKYPGLWGSDFGWAGSGSIDGVVYRQDIVNMAIKKWKEHSLITLMWSMCPPQDAEPCYYEKFNSHPGTHVQGELNPDEWNSITTPGTMLNSLFNARIDAIVPYLQQLKVANVPVLWRPFHEMNANFFWWGANPEKSKILFQLMHDRYINVHHLNNLIWVWNVSEFENIDTLISYYPGDNYVDVLSIDIYCKRFNIGYYNGLRTVSPTKPIALGEVGGLPPVEVLTQQPKWAYFMEWYEYEVYNWPGTLCYELNTLNDYNLFNNSKVLNQNDILNIFKNILINGGFENLSQNSSWVGLNVGWNIITSRPDESHSGQNFVLLSGNGTGVNLTHNIDVVPNTNYQLSFWAKCPTNGSRFNVKDVNNVTVIDGGYTNVGNEWVLYKLNFNSGNNENLKVCIENQGINSYFDDFNVLSENSFPNIPFLFAK